MGKKIFKSILVFFVILYASSFKGGLLITHSYADSIKLMGTVNPKSDFGAFPVKIDWNDKVVVFIEFSKCLETTVCQTPFKRHYSYENTLVREDSELNSEILKQFKDDLGIENMIIDKLNHIRENQPLPRMVLSENISVQERYSASQIHSPYFKCQYDIVYQNKTLRTEDCGTSFIMGVFQNPLNLQEFAIKSYSCGASNCTGGLSIFKLAKN